MSSVTYFLSGLLQGSIIIGRGPRKHIVCEGLLFFLIPFLRTHTFPCLLAYNNYTGMGRYIFLSQPPD